MHSYAMSPFFFLLCYIFSATKSQDIVTQINIHTSSQITSGTSDTVTVQVWYNFSVYECSIDPASWSSLYTCNSITTLGSTRCPKTGTPETKMMIDNSGSTNAVILDYINFVVSSGNWYGASAICVSSGEIILNAGTCYSNNNGWIISDNVCDIYGTGYTHYDRICCDDQAGDADPAKQIWTLDGTQPNVYITNSLWVDGTNVFPDIVTCNPSLNPTQNPSENPSSIPTMNPTQTPSFNPSLIPTVNPTQNPTVNPSLIPTVNPSQNPSWTSTQILTPTNQVTDHTPMDSVVNTQQLISTTVDNGHGEVGGNNESELELLIILIVVGLFIIVACITTVFAVYCFKKKTKLKNNKDGMEIANITSKPITSTTSTLPLNTNNIDTLNRVNSGSNYIEDDGEMLYGTGTNVTTTGGADKNEWSDDSDHDVEHLVNTSKGMINNNATNQCQQCLLVKDGRTDDHGSFYCYDCWLTYNNGDGEGDRHDNDYQDAMDNVEDLYDKTNIIKTKGMDPPDGPMTPQ